jgi:hypothetical protein
MRHPDLNYRPKANEGVYLDRERWGIHKMVLSGKKGRKCPPLLSTGVKLPPKRAVCVGSGRDFTGQRNLISRLHTLLPVTGNKGRGPRNLFGSRE